MGKQKKISYHRTPEIIRETLGEDVYQLFEKCAQEHAHARSERVIKIILSPSAMRSFHEAMKQSFDKQFKPQ